MESMIQNTFQPRYYFKPPIYLWHIDIDERDEDEDLCDFELNSNDNLEFEEYAWLN
jgi:hypothetical protein